MIYYGPISREVIIINQVRDKGSWTSVTTMDE